MVYPSAWNIFSFSRIYLRLLAFLVNPKGSFLMPQYVHVPRVPGLFRGAKDQIANSKPVPSVSN